MKTTKIIYWAATGVFAALMMYSGFLYLTSDEMNHGLEQLGFPQFFRVELGVAKLAGGIALLSPIAPRLKEWVYAGFTINLISAFIAHTSLGDPVSTVIAPIIFFIVLLLSYFAFHRIQRGEVTSGNPASA